MQRTATLLLLALLSGSAAAAPGLDEIVRRHVDAIGGAARWQRLQSMMVRASSPTSTTTWVWKRPDRVRVEERDESYTGKLVIMAFDGTVGWTSNQFKDPAPRRLGPGELQRWRDDLLIRSDLLDLPAKGADLSLVGEEAVDGRPAYKLSLRRTGRKEVLLWIDAQSFLMVQRARWVPTPWGAEMMVKTSFRDYRSVDGLLIAHEVGSAHCSVEVNGEIDEALFRPPESLR